MLDMSLARVITKPSQQETPMPRTAKQVVESILKNLEMARAANECAANRYVNGPIKDGHRTYARCISECIDLVNTEASDILKEGK